MLEGPRAAALGVASRCADPDEAGRILAAGDAAEHALHVAAAGRALRQTIAAGHRYAALPARLVGDVYAVELPPGLCTFGPPLEGLREDVATVCLLELDHDGPCGWEGRDYAAGMLVDQVDSGARLARRVAVAQAAAAARARAALEALADA